jgi:hypothetical protein
MSESGKRKAEREVVRARAKADKRARRQTKREQPPGGQSEESPKPAA